MEKLIACTLSTSRKPVHYPLTFPSMQQIKHFFFNFLYLLHFSLMFSGTAGVVVQTRSDNNCTQLGPPFELEYGLDQSKTCVVTLLNKF